ncbi:MAG: hypothetical protein ACYDBQ_09980 [Thermoplasmatota archaeon]
MFRSDVAEHYRSKGYAVHENVRVRGASGNVYVVDMVCEGPLGNLLISFGDAAGVDGPEMGSVRRIARDLGMTPVLAAEEFSSEFRHRGLQSGVVLLDAEMHPSQGASTAAAWPAPPRLDRTDLDAHPWPASGRAREEDPEPSSVREVGDPVAVPAKPAPSRPAQFGWLGKAAPAPPLVVAPTWNQEPLLPPPVPPLVQHHTSLLTSEEGLLGDGTLLRSVHRRLRRRALRRLVGWGAGAALLLALLWWLSR